MSNGRLRLSILDHTPVSSGSSWGEAYWHSTKLAQLGERHGYERYWIAEHHNMAWMASSSPTVLAAHIAAHTSTIRVGTGSLNLSNYSPLSVVQQMGMLEALHPGRIDLGLGRASGSDQVTAHALQPNRRDFGELFAEMMAFFKGEFPEDHPYKSITATPGRDTMPSIWLLGSGNYSAELSGSMGLPFAHGGHFAGANNVNAIQTYINAFRPSETLKEPYAICSVQVICMETDEEAKGYQAAYMNQLPDLLSGAAKSLIPPEDPEAESGDWVHDPFLKTVPTHYICGSQATVKAELEDLARRTRANELMISTIMPGYEKRLRSFELIAEACL